jgi:hypothetical protein
MKDVNAEEILRAHGGIVEPKVDEQESNDSFSSGNAPSIVVGGRTSRDDGKGEQHSDGREQP